MQARAARPYVGAVNIQPYILQQGIAARHADLVREAAAARRAAQASRRPRRLRFRLGLAAILRARPRPARLEPEN